MKNQIKFLAVILVFVSSSLSAQVRVGGGVNVSIDLPIPEVIIANPGPNRPQPRDREVQRPIEQRRNGNHGNNRVIGYGEIRNQNGPRGLEVLQVVDAQLRPLNNGLENIVYQLNSGDVLELFISTANPQDYNYHFSNHRGYSNNNRIEKVLLNNRYLDLRDGSLSLQPAGQRGFHSVINLHSFYEGDFNGTVNF